MILTRKQLKEVDRVFRDLFKHVSLSLGPNGHTVIIDQKGKRPIITKDGVTIAKHYQADSELGRVVATIVREICQSTDIRVGDGTTSTIIFAYWLYSALRDILENVGMENYNEVMEGCEAAIEKIIKELDSHRTDVLSTDELRQVAFVATNNDKELADVIFSAVDSAGREGSIVTRRSPTGQTEVEIREGFAFSSGYLSANFATDEATMTTRFTNPRVVVTNHSLRTVKQIEPILAFGAVDQRPLVIVAETVEDQALAALVGNNASGKIKICALRAPGAGRAKRGFYEDLALFTNATFIDKDQAMEMAAFAKTYFGEAQYFEARGGEAIIVGGKATLEQLEQRIAFLEGAREAAAKKGDEAETMAEFDIIDARIARLRSTSATILVGGFTEAEITEKRYRVEDALRAIQAAYSHGIITGGGLVGLAIRDEHVFHRIMAEQDDSPRALGEDAAYEACASVFHQLLKSANLQSRKSEIVTTIRNQRGENPNYGFNLKTKQFSDLRQEGIIEPVATFVSVIQNAFSIVKLLLNCSAVIFPPQ
jgi:chaperonin GroEL